MRPTFGSGDGGSFEVPDGLEEVGWRDGREWTLVD